MDNKKFVEAYVAQSGNGYFGNGHVKKRDDGWMEMYIPGYGDGFMCMTYDDFAAIIMKLELNKKHPKWKNNEELHIWYDMNVVE